MVLTQAMGYTELLHGQRKGVERGWPPWAHEGTRTALGAVNTGCTRGLVFLLLWTLSLPSCLVAGLGVLPHGDRHASLAQK